MKILLVIATFFTTIFCNEENSDADSLYNIKKLVSDGERYLDVINKILQKRNLPPIGSGQYKSGSFN